MKDQDLMLNSEGMQGPFLVAESLGRKWAFTSLERLTQVMQQRMEMSPSTLQMMIASVTPAPPGP